MTTSLQQLLHDLYNHIMIPEEKNVVSLANRIIDAKQALAKQELDEEKPPASLVTWQVVPVDLGDVY